MMLFILIGGIIVGILLCIFSLVIVLSRNRHVERALAEFDMDKPFQPFKQMGQAEFIEPTPPEVEAMEAVVDENTKKGRDTKMSEL